jgi:aspartyl-tRNA(Asn)/glutamyl-tRNA(Gln) amidotransferase subunit A
MKTSEFVNEVKKGNISVEENTENILNEAEKVNSEYKYFNVISKELALKQARELDKRIKSGKAKGRLLGVPVSVKDCICVKDVESRAGSKILEGYLPVFNATAVQKAIDEGAVIIGKTAQDEFGFGSFSANPGIGFNRPLNPFDKKRACGGSSGGAAGWAQKAKNIQISLGQSTGGSIACPASFCGVAGLTPTYGLVSRYGLIDYANSLDKIGSIAKTIEDAAQMLEIISGNDPRDSTSLKEEMQKPSVKKIAIIKDSFKDIDENVNKVVLKKLKGIDYDEISLPLTNKYGIAVYYLLATSEASTNLSKYCGMRYGASGKLEGSFNEYFSRVRSENFGKEAKRRIILGTFARMSGFRDAYYLKAAKIRTKIIEEYKKIFKKYDAIISPTMPILPPKFDEIEKLTPLQNYMMDKMTVGPNLAGLPHLSINAGFAKELPVGVMLIADHLKEKNLIELGKRLE